MAANQEKLNTMAKHERVKRPRALPLFYGCKDKNDHMAGDFLDGCDNTATIGKWTTNKRKIEEFTSLFLDRANDWFKSLKDFPGLDLISWANIREVFLSH